VGNCAFVVFFVFFGGELGGVLKRDKQMCCGG
jgi:hypothetical protein